MTITHPRPPPSAERRPSQPAQPKTVKLSWKALLSFPYRMCNPPPAVGTVRSCQVTPVVNVKLDDVLNRKHLPPLGLKDFEEWLLFVEQCPENLYFVLWLKEYTTRYDQWVANLKPIPKPPPTAPRKQYRVSRPPGWLKTSPSLALFYARAKQTFFTPNSSYELDLPSEILGPFHAPIPEPSPDFGSTPPFGAFSPHPDPAVFNEVAYEVRIMLEESLDRFVKATFNNVGNGRGLCGLIGGFVITLLGSVPPVVVNFLTGRGRWLRLLALPGLWIGLTIVLSSLHGVCMMIYLFGDLRQLRTFELSRPAISSPRPLRDGTRRFITPQFHEHFTTISPTASIPINKPPIGIPKQVHIVPQRPNLVIPSSPSQPLSVQYPISPLFPTAVARRNRSTSTNSLVAEVPRLSFPSSSSVVSSFNELHRTNTGSSSDAAHAIHISEAYYDEPPLHIGEEPVSSPVPSSWNSPSPDPIRIPVARAASSHLALEHHVSSSNEPTGGGDQESDIWTNTASFIHPYEYSRWDEDFQFGYDGGDEESSISVRGQGDAKRVVSVSGGASSLSMARDRQPIDVFDFDALPASRAHGGRPRYRKCDASPPPPWSEKDKMATGGTKTLFGPKDLLRRIQGRCGAVRGVLKTVLSRSRDAHQQLPQFRDDQREIQTEKGQEQTAVTVSVHPIDPAEVATVRFKKVSDVPMFKSPLTRILSPVVTRAQWEIVIRSAVVALCLSWGLLAGILAAPVVR